MSTYYSFYVGYTTKDDIVHVFGPYDKFGKLRPIVERSRSFIGTFCDYFNKLDESKMGDDIKKEFSYENNKNNYYGLYYTDANHLPDTNFIKSGYYKTEEVLENMDCDEKYFSEMYNDKEYGLLLQKAVRTDDKDEINRLKEFIYYSFPDYTSDNYLSFLIENNIEWNGPFDVYCMTESLKKHGEGELKDIIILMEIS